MAGTQREGIGAVVLVCFAVALFVAAFLAYVYHLRPDWNNYSFLGASMDIDYWPGLSRHHRQDCVRTQ
jgi:hypothetical protein